MTQYKKYFRFFELDSGTIINLDKVISIHFSNYDNAFVLCTRDHATMDLSEKDYKKLKKLLCGEKEKEEW